MPRDVSPGLANEVPIPIPPPIASSSHREGSSTSGVPLDSIPRDIVSSQVRGGVVIKVVDWQSLAIWDWMGEGAWRRAQQLQPNFYKCKAY